ncbi:hypothetical protein RhiirA4_488193 [Rhizophagus irregularis]|uniref:Uncharacterized protein n=1 Tax=Rhizophagus irregularis TaxID=588596 RepID=A0A2I1H7D5_9GLOM|nr:hypothetical protein RhiirA4_473778 [Rhizophagus irregularis]PKY61472.1 hypothetical protein RhiirA4_486505 [Rhizophagus irregularis]PKY62168.1 hypothetical protein RhiirA4_488193 [Rhizophagus irregularis]
MEFKRQALIPRCYTTNKSQAYTTEGVEEILSRTVPEDKRKSDNPDSGNENTQLLKKGYIEKDVMAPNCDTINILTGNTLNTGGHLTRQNYGYDDIDDDDGNVYDHKKKDVSTWGENVETYRFHHSSTTTFATTDTTTTGTKPSLTISTLPSQQDYPTTQTETRPSLTISISPSQQLLKLKFTVLNIPTLSPKESKFIYLKF